ncbi:UpxY family transcription antiterminator [Arcticibacterium luteifluviistationis]|uniref:Antitermination protein NusG n=1 Tax=Arcticibacterium luteifluviistationis TaxID=1784714 RepID=A0A2Z4GHJ6_9BACT|nr:UpxY family transcription antiterminator [Arcticibacterium luteifluviistationis]AWW00913.1 antitermination protein NusG [Arcticibacterium luteifluviistationis]
MNWYVLYTKPRNEKIVAESLQNIGLETYCPVLKTERKWSDRKKMVEEPLFRSYVFVRLEEHLRNKVFAVPGVVRYLFWLEKPAIVKDKEITTIKNMLSDFEHSDILTEQFEAKDRIKLKSGPLMDIEGRVKYQNGHKIEVLLPSLQLKLVVDTRRTKVSKLGKGS